MKEFAYKGNLRPYAVLLCHTSDQESFRPVMEKIEKNGLKLYLLNENNKNAKALKKACGVIVVLSEHFYDSETLQNALLLAENESLHISYVRADDSEMPETMKRHMYSVNSVRLSKYDTDEAAMRITSGDALKSPKITKRQTVAFRTTIIIAFISVLLLIAGAIGIIFSNIKKEPEVIEETEEPLDLSKLAAFGLTEEDVKAIQKVIIAGDQLIIMDNDSRIEDYLEHWKNEDGDHFILSQDGSEIETGTFTDLSFLQLLSGVKSIFLVNQTAEVLPDLSGLNYLHEIGLYNCEFNDLSGIANCESIYSLKLETENIQDLSFASNIPVIQSLQIRECRDIRSLSGLNASELTSLLIDDCEDLDLSALSNAGKLSEIIIFNSKNINLSSLSGCSALEKFQFETGENDAGASFDSLSGCASLMDVFIRVNDPVDLGFVKNLNKMNKLWVEAEVFSNLGALSGATSLKDLTLHSQEFNTYDLTVLSELNALTSICLTHMNADLSFLQNIEKRDNGRMNKLEFRGDFTGLDALQYISEAENLILELPDNNEALQMLNGENLNGLELYMNHENLDLSLIPENILYLTIFDTELSSFEELSCPRLTEISLHNVQNLASLESLASCENLKGFTVYYCYDMTDWSILDGRALSKLNLDSLEVLPDFSRFSLTPWAELTLNNIPDLTDLSLLDALDEDSVINSVSVTVLSDEDVNLNALFRFKGNNLTVSGNLGMQAEELIRNESFKMLHFESPRSYENETDDITLESLENLETLPKVKLNAVSSFVLAGNTIYGRDYDFYNGWDEDGEMITMGQQYDSDESFQVEMGSLQDLSDIQTLTGLTELTLVSQPIESLDGIQYFSKLRMLKLVSCPVTDLSPVFAVDTLEELKLYGMEADLSGIQNLRKLRIIDMGISKIPDLSPIKEIPFSNDVYEYGFTLRLPEGGEEESPTDLSVLAEIPKYDFLGMNDYREVEWIGYLKGKSIQNACILSSFNGNEDFKEFAESVESIEQLDIKWNEDVTDLTPLLNTKGLKNLKVSPNMEEAVQSLDGLEYSFELIIEE